MIEVQTCVRAGIPGYLVNHAACPFIRAAARHLDGATGAR
jgi:hypothetical protein